MQESKSQNLPDLFKNTHNLIYDRASVSIDIDKKGSHYRLWCNNTILREYSIRGKGRAAQDADMIKVALKSLGYDSHIDITES